ncbi:large ribosomal subunit protein uL1-like, partial [Oculina patagonica]
MAAPVGFVGRRFTSKSSPLLLLSRSYAAKRFRRKRQLAPYENLKLQDHNVYLLSERDPPKHSFTEAMSALRAYNISLSGIVDQVVELYIRVDMGEKGKNKINPFHGLMLLPKPYGVERKVLVFAKDEAAEAARNAGGNIIGGEELIKQVAAGEVTDFDQCLCTLEFLDKMKPLQQVLKEKMPTTRRGTASDDIAAAIETYKRGHPYKCDKDGIIDIGVGKLSFTDSEVRINSAAVLSTVATHRISTK